VITDTEPPKVVIESSLPSEIEEVSQPEVLKVDWLETPWLSPASLDLTRK